MGSRSWLRIQPVDATHWLNRSAGVFGRQSAAISLIDSHINGNHGVWLPEHAFLRLIDAQIGSNIGHGLFIGRDCGAIFEGESLKFFIQFSCRDTLHGDYLINTPDSDRRFRVLQ